MPQRRWCFLAYETLESLRRSPRTRRVSANVRRRPPLSPGVADETPSHRVQGNCRRTRRNCLETDVERRLRVDMDHGVSYAAAFGDGVSVGHQRPIADRVVEHWQIAGGHEPPLNLLRCWFPLFVALCIYSSLGRVTASTAVTAKLCHTSAARGHPDSALRYEGLCFRCSPHGVARPTPLLRMASYAVSFRCLFSPSRRRHRLSCPLLLFRSLYCRRRPARCEGVLLRLY